jgi:hypothetical protein
MTMAPPLKVDPKLLEDIGDWYSTRIIPAVRDVATTLDGGPPLTDDTVGEYGVVAALQRFHDVWSAELTATVDATRQISDAFYRSAAGYRKADDSAGRRFN